MFSYAIMFSVEDLSREIVDLAAHPDAATHRLLTCIRQFDEASGSAVERRRETSVPRWSFNARLKAVFAAVAPEPKILRNSTNCPLYLLCFAVGNQAGAPIALRIANHLLRMVQ